MRDEFPGDPFTRVHELDRILFAIFLGLFTAKNSSHRT